VTDEGISDKRTAQYLKIAKPMGLLFHLPEPSCYVVELVDMFFQQLTFE